MSNPKKNININKALRSLTMNKWQNKHLELLTYKDFLTLIQKHPEQLLRNIFQLFHDMIKNYVGEGSDEYPDDPESIHYVHYNCNKLFVENSDYPFFAGRIFANRLMKQIEAMKTGTQQNKIYIFEGPPGSGKSIFLNNLLKKFEEYTKTEKGLRYEIVWRLDRKNLCSFTDLMYDSIANKIVNQDKTTKKNTNGTSSSLSLSKLEEEFLTDQKRYPYIDRFIEIPCPSHDHPILMIPKEQRRSFLDELFENNELKYKIFTDREYKWIFQDIPCTFCCSLYEALLYKCNSPIKVMEMLYARPSKFNRRLGNGISVYNPGDKSPKNNVLGDNIIQKKINDLLQDSNLVKYIFSRYAKTNNGIYTLMDIKSHNTERLIELHNIISEGVHKIEDIEENVSSLLLALMNPEDKKNIANFQSFSDRIEYINIPYILDHKTEVDIYRNQFGKYIDDYFLPKVLHNFARVIISTRLNKKSEAMLDWIPNPETYSLYCDKNLQLLKMEIYSGYIPTWLSSKDLKRFTAQRRKNVIAESSKEGNSGLSGRESIKIFNEFLSKYKKDNQLISMLDVYNFFTKVHKDLNKIIPEGLLDSLVHMYDYYILQQVKESLYYYNEEQISKNLMNYLFAINFDPDTVEFCNYTNEKLEITETYLSSIEDLFHGSKIDKEFRQQFRKETQEEYSSITLTQEILLDNKPIEETTLFQNLYKKYVYNLKEKVLEPFLKNKNFRLAIKHFNEEEFKTFDKKIRTDVTFLIKNLKDKYNYTELGAREVCIYVIDNDLAKKFEKKN